VHEQSEAPRSRPCSFSYLAHRAATHLVLVQRSKQQNGKLVDWMEKVRDEHAVE